MKNEEGINTRTKIDKARSNTAHTCTNPRGARTLDLMVFQRITVEPDKMAGQPCLRGLRIPVATVVAMGAEGITPAEAPSSCAPSPRPGRPTAARP